MSDGELPIDAGTVAERPHEAELERRGVHRPGAEHAPELDTTYDYVDADGRLSYQVLRYRTAGGGKTFRQRRPDTARDGQWVPNLDGVERVPYRLPDLLDATDAGGTVVVVEGEKDAERLAAELPVDVAITTNAQGAGWEWPATWADYFRGASTVYVIADNDAQGRSAAHHRGRIISKAVRDVRVVEVLPRVGDKGDASDFLDAGGDVEELWRALESGRPPRPAEDDANAPSAALLERYTNRTIRGAGILDLPEPRPLIDGYLSLDSLAVLSGPPGAGKSLLLLDWAASVATASWWHGHAVTPGPVLYVVAEGASGMAARFNAWRLRAGIFTPELFEPIHWLLDAPNLYDVEQAAAFTAYAAELRPALIILDTFARVIVGAEENSAKDVGLVVSHLELLREATGACVLAAHHTPKSGEGIRGSTALLGAVDTHAEIKPLDGTLSLGVAKQKNAALIPDFRMAIVGEGDSVVLTPAKYGAEVALDTLPPNYRKAIEALYEADTGKGASSTDWVTVAGGMSVSKATLYRARARLVELGAVVDVGNGGRFPRYSLTDAGRDVIGAPPKLRVVTDEPDLGDAPPLDEEPPAELDEDVTLDVDGFPVF